MPALISLFLPMLLACGAEGQSGSEQSSSGSSGQEARSSATFPGGAEAAQEAIADRPRQVDINQLGFDAGDMETAVVRVVEFADYGCGYCKQFHEEVYPEIEERFISTGKVAWKYVPFVVGLFRHAELAALAGICAGDQGRHADYMDRLYAGQAAWKNSDEDPSPMFLSWAEEAGLDMEAFRSCYEGQELAEDVTLNTAVAQRLGIRGTPTFFVRGYAPIQGTLPKDLFIQAMEQAISDAENGTGPWAEDGGEGGDGTSGGG